MDFDFEHMAAPFRMQPGLRRMPAGVAQLTPLDPASRLAGEKRAVLALGTKPSGTLPLCTPGFDPTDAIESIANHVHSTWTPGTFDSRMPLALAFEEDLAVVDGEHGTIAWLNVCVPSHWAPEDKIGLPFAAVHAPVADNAQLLAASAALVKLVTSLTPGEPGWERFVWTLTASPHFDQHPRRAPKTPWPELQHPATDPERFARAAWLRAERQTFLPVTPRVTSQANAEATPHTRQAVFTIRVMMEPLVEAVRTPAQARRLHDSLASMSDAVLAYRQLTAARAPLLAWLAGRFAATP